MAYSTSNPPVLLVPSMGEGVQLWAYYDGDVVGDVDAAGYFTNGEALGMRVGDVVFVSDTTTPLVTVCWVSAVSTTATVTQHA